MPSLIAIATENGPFGISALGFLTLVLAIGVAAQWIAWRLKLPSILLLLAFGFALGQITGVRIDDFLAEGDGHSSPLLSVVGLFVAIILFEGGLTLKFRELREAGTPILRLCTLAVAVSFALTTWFMAHVLGYDFWLSALTGAILTVTGPTVIAPLLRHVNPPRKMTSMIKWEGIVVDPIGAILAVLVFRAALSINAEAAWLEIAIAIGKVIIIVVVGGFVLAKIVEFLLRKHLIPDYLQPVFLLAVVAVAFTLSNQFEKEAGLLTVTVLGIFLANQRSVSVKHILEFKENLRTLIISSLFIVLSGRIGPEELQHSLLGGLALLAFIIVIGRPLSIFLALFGTNQTNYRERTFLAFLAPRGIVAAAVASIFALEFEAAARGDYFGENASRIAAQAADVSTLIFLIIIGTVTIYGLAAVPLARALGLTSKNPTGVLFAGADPWARLAAATLKKDDHRVMLLDTNYANISEARLLGLEAHRANILSEFAEEELDFNGLGSLVAGTPNDEVNSIATQRFIHQFGRAGVWQLAPVDRHDSEKNTASHELRSQICFTGGPNHAVLSEIVEQGASVKKSLITEVYTYQDFLLTYENQSTHILFLNDRNGLRPAPEKIKQINPGTTIYFLAPAESEPDEPDQPSAE